MTTTATASNYEIDACSVLHSDVLNSQDENHHPTTGPQLKDPINPASHEGEHGMHPKGCGILAHKFRFGSFEIACESALRKRVIVLPCTCASLLTRMARKNLVWSTLRMRQDYFRTSIDFLYALYILSVAAKESRRVESTRATRNGHLSLFK